MIDSIFRDPCVKQEDLTSNQLESKMAEWLYLKNDVILGDEYSHLIQNYRQYCQKYNFQIYANVPKFIYLAPKNGTIFFLKGNDLKEVRFPKLEDFQKKFKWKKMNFITHLPKKDPKVSYLVASTYSMESSPCFRMHLVILYNNRLSLKLCHILQIYPRQNENENLLGSPSSDQHFYKLDSSLLLDPNCSSEIENELPIKKEFCKQEDINHSLEPLQKTSDFEIKLEEVPETIYNPIRIPTYSSSYYDPNYNPMRSYHAEMLHWE